MLFLYQQLPKLDLAWKNDTLLHLGNLDTQNECIIKLVILDKECDKYACDYIKYIWFVLVLEIKNIEDILLISSNIDCIVTIPYAI